MKCENCGKDKDRSEFRYRFSLWCIECSDAWLEDEQATDNEQVSSERAKGQKRIQRKRTKGWRMPTGAIYAGRASQWGNPFKVVRQSNGNYTIERKMAAGAEILAFCFSTEVEAKQKTVELFEAYARMKLVNDPHWLDPLIGHDIACWCSLDDPCHVDVILQLTEEIEKERGNEKC